jgi:Prokaryotic membrane lipoprotein lipid attachment site.
MKKISIILSAIFILAGCTSRGIKNTTWKFATEGATSTIVFSDSTYKCIINFEGKAGSDSGTYKYKEPIVSITSHGKILKAIIKGDRMTTRERDPITFIREKK